jgi:hypothetical protein
VIRLMLVVLCAALAVLAVLGMRRGWRNRLARQSDLPDLPAVPADLGPVLLSATGLYVGSAFAGSWQDRVVHGGLGVPAETTAEVHAGGLLLRRNGASTLFVPRQWWQGARLAPGLAGRVVGEGGLLVLRWQLGGALVDTGFRADDKTAYPEWVATLNGKVNA